MLVAKRYKLGPSIGRGGMGEVFRATDEVLGRTVAVKLLLPSDRDPRAAERFHREAQAAARLSDPQVVSVYDFGNHDDGFFLVMELVEGGTVADELTQHGPLPKDRAIDIVEQAAAGLAAAHREDVVHRDVKPGNLLVAPGGAVKVADFGIAHLPGQGATTLTATGQIIGSSHYLAPERARGGRAGKASDVYSLGCVLYQLVTGRPPFTAENPTAILYQHVDAEPVRPSLERPELAGSFETVLLRMLAKEPADRPTAAEIADGALRAQQPLGDDWRAVAGVPAAAGLAAAATVPSAADVPAGVDAPAGTGAPVGTSQLEVAPRSPRRPSTKVLAGLVAVLATTAAVLAGVAIYGNDPTLPPTTDLGPQPELTTPTPGTTAGTTDPTTTSSTTGPTQAAPGDEASPTASTQPTQTPSTQQTPSPGTTPTSGTTPSPTTSPTGSVEPTPTPSQPTRTTPSPEPTPSTTPSSDPSPTSTPPATPTPGPARNTSSPSTD
ncbi:protein kinase domain-containing protein [Kribbella sp. CA-253562]|uniref:protein kinase domain-containing protein n=1 Tax=Kribbella sp. CA-253562 TaxID=3239942 RepID=UPI003D949715